LVVILLPQVVVKPVFSLLPADTDVRGLSQNGRFTCGAVHKDGKWQTAVWDRDRLQRTSDLYAKGGNAPLACGVDNRGDAVAYKTDSRPNSPFSLGFRWLSGKAVQPLKVPGFTMTWPRAISGDGDVIIGTAIRGDFNWPVKWLPNGSAVFLQPNAKTRATECGEALGVSVDGRTIVGHLGDAKGHEATQWMSTGATKRLKHPGADLPKSAYREDYAWATSADGKVVVGHCAVGSRRLPVVWSGPGKGKFLELPPGVVGDGMARGVSADGRLIAGFCGFGEKGIGLVWQSSTVTAAAKFLESKGLKSAAAGIRITAVLGVSADGHVLAGECFDHAHHLHGWRASF
jgi:uncharacterized membrane protein